MIEDLKPKTIAEEKKRRRADRYDQSTSSQDDVSYRSPTELPQHAAAGYLGAAQGSRGDVFPPGYSDPRYPYPPRDCTQNQDPGAPPASDGNCKCHSWTEAIDSEQY
jgi:hypothetical protein